MVSNHSPLIIKYYVISGRHEHFSTKVLIGQIDKNRICGIEIFILLENI